MSTKSKVLLFLKKLAKNATISFFTGVDPAFLDNDLSFLRNNTFESFMQCDLLKLAYSVNNDFLDGVNELINRLKSNNKIQTLKEINLFIDDVVKWGYEKEKYADYSFLLEHMFLNFNNIFDEIKSDKWRALLKRHINLELEIDFISEMRNVYSNVYNNSSNDG